MSSDLTILLNNMKKKLPHRNRVRWKKAKRLDFDKTILITGNLVEQFRHVVYP